MSPLRDLSDREAGYLKDFRASDQAQLLVRLVHAECLLELSRRGSGCPDLLSYAEAVVDTLKEYLPVEGLGLSVHLDGDEIRLEYGDLEKPSAPSVALDLGEDGRGELRIALEPPDLCTAGFMEAVGEQISIAVNSKAEAERLRSRAALADFTPLIGRLTDDLSQENLRSLVKTLVDLPGVQGAVLDIDQPAGVGTLQLTAGLGDAAPFSQLEVPGGSLSVALKWAEGAMAQDRQAARQVIAMVGDAVARFQEHRELTVQAQTDPLTGLANRRAALAVLSQAIRAARQSAEPVAVVYFDLDHFKQLNDRFGHPTGDIVLVNFARHLGASVRSTDTVGRLGGEEFVVVCSGFGEKPATALAKRIIQSTAAACRTDAAPGWAQTASAGLAFYPTCGQHADEVLQEADRALYAAKQRGRNQLSLSSRLDDHRGPVRRFRVGRRAAV